MEKIRGSESKVRVGRSLNDAEKQHVAKRREKVLQSLIQQNLTISPDVVPNIAVMGSGGGLRAMVGLLGSLSQLKKEGLLDSITYLSGVSGSTWCMASLYKEADWSTKLETVKQNIAKRMADGKVNWLDQANKLAKYFFTKDNFSLTDIWSALAVSSMVNEVDEHSVTEQRDKDANNPYPIYTVIDKQSKYDRLKSDPWFEITPDESGYSLMGAFVNTSFFGSKFENGNKIKDQPQMDMLYLQGLCGSVLADMESLLSQLLTLIKAKTKTTAKSVVLPKVQNGYQMIQTLVELNLCALKGGDCSVYQKTLKNLVTSESKLAGVLNSPTSKKANPKADIQDTTLQVCNSFFDVFGEKRSWDSVWIAIVRSLEKIISWVWGTTYNYVNKMKVVGVHPSILSSVTREYEDAGLLNNSPYMSVLRKERNIDLIISLDFSAGDQLATVSQIAQQCRELYIPFPALPALPVGGTIEPQDFYVFRGTGKTPTVIHIPLFNKVNCKGEVKKWQDTYKTDQLHYTATMISDLLEKAALNIKNNKQNLLNEIKYAIERKKLG
ncbi:cytosolic phospholipase A2 gamma-like [Astyanax mexicanus]|uniref:Cytosolic phospholipase A2 gamma-like n=1 Tax=Astyanax mexicanus TaxID=7994 RepID=A0A8T2MD41_ASTMX|nr:cytosolic phospholipase A2 gamma-like [Astyanax mexicanus]